jgi:hypothetical protein
MTNKAASFGGHSPGLLHQHGGKISSLTGELSIHAMGDDYTVEDSGTITSLPTVNVGVSAVLRILNAPTFTNSPNLLCPNGLDYQGLPGDLILARSDGDGVWRLFPIPAGGPVVRNHLSGLTLSTAGASSTFGVSAGVVADSTNVGMMTLASAFTKTTSTWTVGSGNGALDTGSIANNAWYHVYLIKNLNLGIVDVTISLSAVAPAAPSPGYAISRRIGSMLTDGSGHWTAFTQNGDEFLWLTPIRDISTAAIGTSQTLSTMTVPTGVKVNVLFAGWANNVAQAFLLFTSPDQGNPAPSGSLFSLLLPAGVNSVTGLFNLRTNTSGQISLRCDTASTTVSCVTQGWGDTRGRVN